MKNFKKLFLVLFLMVMIWPFANVDALTAAYAGKGKSWGGNCTNGSNCEVWYNPIYDTSTKERLYCLDYGWKAPSSSGVNYVRLSKYDIKGVGAACAFIETKVPTNYWNYNTFLNSGNSSAIVKNDYLIKTHVQQKNKSTTKCSSYTKVSGFCDSKAQNAIFDDTAEITASIGEFSSSGDYYVADVNVSRAGSAGNVKFKVLANVYKSGKVVSGAIITSDKTKNDNVHNTFVNVSKLYFKIPKDLYNSVDSAKVYVSLGYTTTCKYKAPMLEAYYPSSFVTNGSLNSTGLKYFYAETGRGRDIPNSSSVYQSLSRFTTYEGSVSGNFYVNKLVTKNLSSTLGLLNINKVDSSSNLPLAGVKFGLYSGSGCKTSINNSLVTDEDGSISITLDPGTYSVKELDTIDGYRREYNKCHEVEIAAKETETLNIRNDKLGSIEINKTEYGTNKVVSGAQFKLYKDSACSTEITENNYGVAFGPFTTNSSGKVVIDKLRDATYYIKEASPAAGYKVNNECIPVDVKVGKQTSVYVENYKKYTLTINKTDAKSGASLSGVKFKLCSDNLCNTVAKDIDGSEIGSLVTNSDGKIVVNNLKYGVYYYKEIEVPSGYSVDASVKSVLVNKDVTLNIENSKITIQIEKVSLTDKDDNLPGATIAMEYLSNAKTSKDLTDVQYSNFVTTDDVNTVSVLPGVYLIYEELAPSGYMVLEDAILVEIDSNGKISKYTKNDFDDLIDYDVNNDSNYFEISDNKIVIANEPTYVKISKQDITSFKEIAGAEIVIYDENGEEVVKYISDGKVSKKFYLEPGNYTLVENIAPKGYKKVETKFVFTIAEDGSILLEDEDNTSINTDFDTIILYNEPQVFDVPITGLSKNVILISLGMLLVGGGIYIIYKKRKAY